MQQIDSNTFDEIVYDKEETCLVMFTRKSCHVCKLVHPKLEELAEDEDFKGKFGFYEVDVEEQSALFNRFSLKGVPQVLFFKDGDFMGKKAGDHETDEYEDKINKLLD